MTSGDPSDEVGSAARPPERIPSVEFEAALRTGSGPLYESVVATVRKANPSIPFADVETLLISDLLGPFNPSEVFLSGRYVAYIPSEVELGGVAVPVLECHPYIYLQCRTVVVATRAAFVQQFGGLEGYNKARAGLIAEGGRGEDMDELVVKQARAMIHAGISKARADAAKVDGDPNSSHPPGRGCATTAAVSLLMTGALAYCAYGFLR